MKSNLCFFILLFYGLYVQAQEQPDFQKKVRFGVKTGINGSLFTRNVTPTANGNRTDLSYFNRYFRASALAGLTVDGQLTDRITLGAELLFNSRGMVYREKNNYVIIVDDDGQEQQAYNNFNYNIDYVEFPILISYNFKPSAYRLFLSTYAGMAPAIAVNSKTKLRYQDGLDGDGGRGRNETLPLKYVNHFNNSLLVGIKVGDNTPFKINLFGDFRLSYMLLPVFSRSVSDQGDNLDARMFTCSASVGIRF
ncbi:hypothetical protein CPT03_04435 [Pedobacter ginsengisoli]|uniref:Outer membrane protein beta-barrel domain-containing protein n=1 Tax=Pedobacter ginsengisoli TaxID=363852 RepID=A0A2D1U2D2_9SPHI|nr:porin family protein [Pedobacter ginsengisoli]ATP55768.1 hypothetical protein CPT03_04435 [Pedobacter ginsengisoli]